MNEPIALSAKDAEAICSARSGEMIIDGPCGKVRCVVLGERVLIGGQEIGREELARARSAKVLYAPEEGELRKIQLFSGRLFKLAPTGGFPALEIDGVRMHRTKDMLPEEEARMKLDALEVRPGQLLLDICTGLGYSAVEAAERGARVVSVEKEACVIELARRNPCSRRLFELLRLGDLKLIIADAARLVACFPDRKFDRIMHDPPSFSLAGDLYSLEYYRELRRIIKDNGVLLHYTGQPGSKYRRRDLQRSVGRRLAEAGFGTRWFEEVRCLVCRPAPRRRRGQA